MTVVLEIGRLMAPETVITLPGGTPDGIVGEPPTGTANKETEQFIDVGIIVVS